MNLYNYDPLLIHRHRTTYKSQVVHTLPGYETYDDTSLRLVYEWNKFPYDVSGKHLVLGFVFSPAMRSVVLIGKKRPAWQEGKLNGVGGKCETFDLSSRHAMTREFREEAGVEIPIEQWTHFATLQVPADVKYNIVCFSTTLDDLTQVLTMTDEQVGVYQVDELGEYDTIPNIPWLIMMAKVFDREQSDIMMISEYNTK